MDSSRCGIRGKQSFHSRLRHTRPSWRGLLPPFRIDQHRPPASTEQEAPGVQTWRHWKEARWTGV